MKNHYLSSAWRLLILLLLPLVSHAQFQDNHVYKIINRRSGLAMEIGGDFSQTLQIGRYANQWQYYGAANQQWYIRPVGQPNGGYYLVNRGSGQVLDVIGGSTNEWATAVQWYSDGTLNQRWNIEPGYHSGAWRIKNLNSDKVLTPDQYSLSAGAAITQASTYGQRDATVTQTQTSGFEQSPMYPRADYEWDIVDVTVNRKVYEIVNALSGKLLTANRDSKRVSQFSDWGEVAAQEWTFTDLNGDYTIVNRNNQQVLEIGGGGNLYQSGREANIWDNFSHPWQQWSLLDAANPTRNLTLAEASDGRRCTIYNFHTTMRLIINGQGSQLYDEDRVVTQQPIGNGVVLNQQWYVREVQYNSQNRATASSSSPLSTPKLGSATGMVDRALALYPNPVHNMFSVSLSALAEPKSVRVTDVRGGATTARYQGNGKVDVANLAPGLYVVTVSDGQREYRQKFIKE